MESKTWKIGITGGMGSGKSTVCKVFALLGVPVYDADSGAKRVLNTNPRVRKEIIELFGEESYKGNVLDNRYLAKLVFNDKEKVEKLNHIVHPGVGEDFEEWMKDKQGMPYILKEAALMYEAGSDKTLDKIITVFAPKEIRLKRVMSRDVQRSESEILAIMDKQISEEEKMKRADFVLYNDDQKLVIPQVIALHRIISNLK